MPLFIRATDLATLLACDRMLYLDAYGDTARREPPTAFERWLHEDGRRFEQHVVDTLLDGAQVPTYTGADLTSGFRATLALMRRGVPRIHGGVLLDGDMVGIPDLLERVDGASGLGAHHYRPVDIKSASKSAPEHRLQVMFYVMLLERVQGVRAQGALYLREQPAAAGEDPRVVEEAVEYDGEALAAQLDTLREVLAAEEPPQPFICSTCSTCGWRMVCRPLAEDARDVSLVTGMHRKVWVELHARGIQTLPVLAATDPGALVEIRGVGEKTARSLVRQAQSLTRGEAIRLRPPEMPSPHPEESFFDVESYPPLSLTYLFGLLVRRGSEWVYEWDGAGRVEAEGRAWEGFLRRASALRGPVYHYGSFEKTTIREMVARHGPDPRADALLERLVDLRRVLGASVVLPLHGYSLKDVAPWIGYQWQSVTQAADDSIVDYTQWLETSDPAHFERIVDYNEEDVRATRAVRDWLLAYWGR